MAVKVDTRDGFPVTYDNGLATEVGDHGDLVVIASGNRVVGRVHAAVWTAVHYS
ncbi:hypothetical protein N857_gp006 [Mycobacterium phage Wanda]|uniref:hypothetical protein n=1 Tax=Mycobacterium phage Wanda TaxID=1340713 RepID=UPI000387E7E9|nr:hypothetical protein N857_gp006 [Mycobacterium phage Wanda]AGT11710.1 hypothetical protein PBI_WANDA_6 [Mycobacterium phage Wanda]ATN89722.1 hypothetical protein SEA_KLEIN_6 [Mycobacterium phage Klein]